MNRPFRFYLVALLISALIPLSCANLNLAELDSILKGNAPLTQETVAKGLLEALTIGTERTSATLSKDGGFSSNSLLRIALPSELQQI